MVRAPAMTTAERIRALTIPLARARDKTRARGGGPKPAPSAPGSTCRSRLVRDALDRDALAGRDDREARDDVSVQVVQRRPRDDGHRLAVLREAHGAVDLHRSDVG